MTKLNGVITFVLQISETGFFQSRHPTPVTIFITIVVFVFVCLFTAECCIQLLE